MWELRVVHRGRVQKKGRRVATLSAAEENVPSACLHRAQRMSSARVCSSAFFARVCPLRLFPRALLRLCVSCGCWACSLCAVFSVRVWGASAVSSALVDEPLLMRTHPQQTLPLLFSRHPHSAAWETIFSVLQCSQPSYSPSCCLIVCISSCSSSLSIYLYLCDGLFLLLPPMACFSSAAAIDARSLLHSLGTHAHTHASSSSCPARTPALLPSHCICWEPGIRNCACVLLLIVLPLPCASVPGYLLLCPSTHLSDWPPSFSVPFLSRLSTIRRIWCWRKYLSWRQLREVHRLESLVKRRLDCKNKL